MLPLWVCTPVSRLLVGHWENRVIAEHQSRRETHDHEDQLNIQRRRASVSWPRNVILISPPSRCNCAQRYTVSRASFFSSFLLFFLSFSNRDRIKCSSKYPRLRESSFYFLITYDDIKSGWKDGGGEGEKKGKRAREEKLREGREKINGRSKKATESSVIFRKSTNYVF